MLESRAFAPSFGFLRLQLGVDDIIDEPGFSGDKLLNGKTHFPSHSLCLLEF